MSTNAGGHYRIEDMRPKGHRIAPMIGTWLAWFVVALVLHQSFIYSFVTASALAVLVRGLAVTIDGPDDTIKWTVWGRPTALRITVAAVFAVSLFLELASNGNGMTWLLFGGGTLALAAYAAQGMGRLTLGSNRDFNHPAAATSPEDAAAGRALAAVHPSILDRAGLSIKSQYSALARIPTILGRDYDDKGRPAFEVQVFAGEQTVEDYEKRAGNLASAWGVPRVKVTEPRPHIARITAIMSEEGLFRGIIPWEPMDTREPILSYMTHLPMGIDVSTKEPWTLDLTDRAFVVGGLSRWGKSSFSNALIAHLVRHPDARVAYVDLKRGVEAKAWGDALDLSIENSDGDAGTLRALEFISSAIDDMSGRYQRMGDAGVTNAITEGFLGPQEPLKLIVIDECSELFKSSTPERSKLANRCIEELATLNQQGLGAGYFLIMMTQRPKETTLPLQLRDNMSTRIGFKLNVTGMTGVFGNDYFPSDPLFDSTKIITKGQAVVMDQEAEEPQRIQMVWLDKDGKGDVIGSARGLQRPWLDAAKVTTYAPAPAPANPPTDRHEAHTHAIPVQDANPQPSLDGVGEHDITSDELAVTEATPDNESGTPGSTWRV